MKKEAQKSVRIVSMMPPSNQMWYYEEFEGGIGLTKKAFDFFEELIKMTYDLIKECKCEDSCPACIYSPKCGNENQVLHKETAKIILEEIVTIQK